MSGANGISLVATLIAAYKEGVKITDRIKKNRVQKGVALPPPELEKALRDGEVRISETRDENSDVKVDMEAQMALKDLIIEVQGTLLHQLVEAEQDDSFNDFAATTQMAVRVRRKAINVLNDLYQRAEDEAMTRDRQAAGGAQQLLLLQQQQQQQQQQLMYNHRPDLATETVTPSSQLQLPQTQPQNPIQHQVQHQDQDQSEEESAPRRFFSMRPKQNKSGSNQSSNASTNTVTNNSNGSNGTGNGANRMSGQYNPQTSPALQPAPLSPMSPQQCFSSTMVSSPMVSSPQMTMQQWNHSISNPVQSPLMSAAQTPRTRSTWSNSSTVPPNSQVQEPVAISIQPIPKPPDNNNNLQKSFGFCKGAWYAQRLSMEKATGKPSLRSYGWAFHCKKCNFRLQADVRDRNRPRFDDRIYQTQNTRFRMLFLLKSHMPLNKHTAAAAASSRHLGSHSSSAPSFSSSLPQDQQRAYACLLCALAGTAKRCNGEDHLMEHIQRHMGQTLGDVYIDGPISISPEGVNIVSRDTFDVCFGDATTTFSPLPTGNAQFLDGKQIDFAPLPPPAAMAVELDASQPLPLPLTTAAPPAAAAAAAAVATSPATTPTPYPVSPPLYQLG